MLIFLIKFKNKCLVIDDPAGNKQKIAYGRDTFNVRNFNYFKWNNVFLNILLAKTLLNILAAKSFKISVK